MEGDILYLGGAIGMHQFVETFTNEKILEWTQEIERLGERKATERTVLFKEETGGRMT